MGWDCKPPVRVGSTQVAFDPLDFIARLAALVPRPRGHLLRYHGLFAPNARHRHQVVPEQVQPSLPDPMSPPSSRPSTSLGWMQRLHRAFGFDLSRCPRCGAALRVLAHITDPRVIAAIVEHLDARAPP